MSDQRNETTHREYREVLREATREAHERLHHHRTFQTLMNGTLTIPDYVRLLIRMHGFYVPFDRAVQRACSKLAVSPVEFSYEPRTPRLAKDIADLGVCSGALSQTPQCSTTGPFPDRATLAGALYVVEGSVLGGSVISRAAKKVIGDDGDKGLGYWVWCRKQGAIRWSMIEKYIKQLEERHCNLRQMVGGASATFHELADWLAPLDSGPLRQDEFSR